MDLSIQCPKCGSRLKAKTKHVGKQLPCPKCREVFVVTAPEDEPVVADILPLDRPDATAADADPLDLGHLDLGPLAGGDSGGPALTGSNPTLSSRSTDADLTAARRLMMWAVIGGAAVSVMVVVLLVAVGVGLLRSGGEPGGTETALMVPPVAPTQPSPTPPKPPDAKEVARAEAAKLAAAVQAQRQACESGLYVRFETSATGQRVAVVGADVDKKFPTERVCRYPLPDGVGLPLRVYGSLEPGKQRWTVGAPAGAERTLVEHRVEGEAYRLTRLRPFGTPPERVPASRSDDAVRASQIKQRDLARDDHKHLWSADGKWLYVLRGTDAPFGSRDRQHNRLLKVNAETWETELQVQTDRDAQFWDMAWCSLGLAVVVQSAAAWFPERDGEQKEWWPLGGVDLAVLDPETFAVRKRWAIPSVREIGGGRGNATVYLRGDRGYLLLVNIETGELLNILRTLEVPGANVEDFTHPEVAPDGKWLLTNGPQTGSVCRFRIADRGLALEQRRAAATKRVRITADGAWAAFAGANSAAIAPLENLTQTLGSVRCSPGSTIALDPRSKTVYVCGVDREAKCLKLRIMQDVADLELVLDGTGAGSASATSQEPAVNQPGDVQDYDPIDMSADPTGRGAIVFVENAAYWVEPKKSGEKWALGGAEPTRIAAFDAPAPQPPPAPEPAPPPPVAPGLIAKPLPAKLEDSDLPGTFISLEVTLKQVTFDPDTGDVALLTALGDLYVCHAAFFEGDVSAVIGPLQFAGEVACCFKALGNRRLLIVAHDGVIWSLDATTLQVAEPADDLRNPIDLPSDVKLLAVASLTASRSPEDATLVVACGGERRVSSAFRLDLTTGKRRADAAQPVAGPTRPIRYAYDTSASTAARTAPASDQDWLAFLGGKPGNRSEPVLADPYGQLRVPQVGVPADAAKSGAGQTARFAGRVTNLCVLEKRPWIVSRDDRELIFFHREDFREGRRVALPPGLQPPTPPRDGPPPTTVMDDAARDRLLIVGNPRRDYWQKEPAVVWMLPLAAQLPDEPPRAVRVPLPLIVEPEKPLSVPIEAADARVEVTLAQPLPGARIDAGRFTWTPRREDVGMQKLVFRARVQGKSSDVEYRCCVGDYDVPLAFIPNEISLSADGSHAVAWNAAWPPAFNKPDEPQPQLAVVDVRQRRILASRPVQRPISHAVAAAGHVFVLEADGLTLEVWRLDDLSPVRTLAFTKAMRDMQTLGERFLVLTYGQQGFVTDVQGQLLVWQLPDLTETPLTRVLSGEPTEARINRTADGWLVGPAVMDEELKSMRFLHSLKWTGVLYLVSPAYDAGSQPIGMGRRTATLRNGVNERGTPMLGGGRLSVGVAATAEDSGNGRGDAIERLSLTLTATPAAGPASRQIPWTAYVPRFSDGKRPVAASGQGVAVIANRRLFTAFAADLGADIPQDAGPLALALRPAPGQREISATAATTVQFTALAGKPPYVFTCGNERNSAGYRSDDLSRFVQAGAQPGTFVIDGPSMVKTICTGITFDPFPHFASRRREPTAEALIDAYVQEVRPHLHPYLRREIRGFPVALPLQVAVTDADKQKATLSYPLVLELPRERVAAMLRPIVDARHRQPPPPPSHPLAKRDEGAARPVDVPLVWTDARPADVSERIRQAWPRLPMSSPEWGPERLAAYYAIEENERYLSLDRVDAGSVALLDGPNLRELWMESLLRYKPRELRAGRADTPDEIWHAMTRFTAQFGCVLPRAIVDGRGRPLLSWRVLLLPYLGHERLFQMFHLDEPWDSEHNRQLLPYLPVFYAPRVGSVPLGRTTLLAVAGPRTAFPGDCLRRYHDFTDPLADTLFLVEVDPKSAVEWTKPEDLEVLADGQAFARLWRTPLAGSTDEYFVGLFGDGYRSVIRVSKNATSLLRAAQIDDAMPSGVRDEPRS